MDYVVTFLEGIITFVSPCLLPMLPIYLAYFAGSSSTDVATGKNDAVLTRRTVINALGFICGFTIIFLVMGAAAGAFGSLLATYRTALNVICGLIVIVLGLNFMGILRIPFLQKSLNPQTNVIPSSFPSALLFGLVFSISWTPCVGAYLGSALLLASTQGSALHGILLLLAFSAGLGIPFIISALIIQKLAGAFAFIKKHYRIINRVCGALLIIVGILMATGNMNLWLSSLAGV